MAEPGEVIIGRWAHVRYRSRQHLVVADEPTVDSAEPIRFACGRRTWRAAVWHDPAEPHLARCKSCQKASA